MVFQPNVARRRPKADLYEAYLLRQEARRILGSQDTESMAIFISHLSLKQGNQEKQEAEKLWRLFIQEYTNAVSLKLFQAFECTQNSDLIRFSSLFHLRALLETKSDFLCPIIITALKRVVVLCLSQEMPELVFKVLSRVVSLVAADVFIAKKGEWNALRDYISFMIDSDCRKALRVFRDLPLTITNEFSVPLFRKISPEILNRLDPTDGSIGEDWVLAFGAAFNLGVQNVISKGQVSAAHVSDVMIVSMTRMVNEGMEVFVSKGLEEVACLVKQEGEWYLKKECSFVLHLISKINGIEGAGAVTKQAAKRVFKELEKSCKEHADDFLMWQAKSLLATTDHTSTAALISHVFPLEKEEAPGERQDAKRLYRFCVKHFPNCLFLKLCKVFERSRYDIETRTRSISLLHSLITHLNNNHQFLSSIALPRIKPLLISCLRLETPDINFKILSRVVSLVAGDVFCSEDSEWHELQEFILSTVDLDFRKAIYVFHELPMLMDDDFLMPLLEKIHPIILSRLDPQQGTEHWALAFAAAFRVAVQPVDAPRHDLTTTITEALLQSVTEMVNGRKEEILRGGLEDLAMLVKEGAPKYYRREFNFVSDLLVKIVDIEGMEKETKEAVQKVSQTLEENWLLSGS